MDKEELDRRFSDLYRAHLRDVYSYSYYRVGNHHDAEDLTEQTFLQAYRHYERALSESDGRPLRPWLVPGQPSWSPATCPEPARRRPRSVRPPV